MLLNAVNTAAGNSFIVSNMAQMLVLGYSCCVEKPYYKRKTPLVVGGTRTQVLEDSIAIAASALNHWAT